MTKAIREEMEKEGTDHVWLSMEHIPKETILKHFPNIYEHCLEEGYDVTKECIPVVPAQHYFMGGIWVDSDSRTSMEHLYAVGRQAVMVYMVLTVWQVTHFWKVWYLQSAQQQRLQKKKHRKKYLNVKRYKML